MKQWYKKLLITLNIVLYFVTIAIWISIPDELTLNISTTLFALTMTIVLMILYKADLKKYYDSTQFAGIVNTFIASSLLLCLIGATNYIFYKKPAQLDLSLNKSNSLSDKSKKILASMKDNLSFKLFATKDDGQAVIALLDVYKLSKPDIRIEFVDIDLHPEEVKANNITRSMTVLASYRGRTVSLYASSELAITNKLIELNRKEKVVIYYTTNHQELDLNSDKETGGVELFKEIKNNLIDLRPLNLLTTSTVPGDGTILMILGPKTNFQKNEVTTVDSFLEKGGKLVIALDPDIKENTNQLLRKMLNKFEISISNSVVIDTKKYVNGSNGTVPITDVYDNAHPITQEFTGTTFFPLTSAITRVDSDKKIGIFKSVALSSPFPGSWQENSLKELLNGQVTFQNESDQPGPICMMGSWQEVSSDQNKPRARIIAFGTSQLVSNAYKNYSSNIILFTNSISWLMDDLYLISLDTPTMKANTVYISAPQIRTIFYFSVVFGPLILAIISFISYKRRAIG